MRWRHSPSILMFTWTSFSLGGAARTVASQSEVPSGVVIHYKEFKKFRVDVETNSGLPNPNDGGKVRP
jgi:hypothetical protein